MTGAVDVVGDEEIVDYCREHFYTGRCPLCVAEV